MLSICLSFCLGRFSPKVTSLSLSTTQKLEKCYKVKAILSTVISFALVIALVISKANKREV